MNIKNTAQRDRYTSRHLAQTFKWVNGISEHNYIDDECTPDFSCCVPDIFITDASVRQKIYQSHVERVKHEEKNHKSQ